MPLRHVALNVPEPLLPEKSVTCHLKSVHESCTDPDPSPGSDCFVAQTPPRSCADALDGLVVLDSWLKEQPAPARTASIGTTIRILRFIELIRAYVICRIGSAGSLYSPHSHFAGPG